MNIKVKHIAILFGVSLYFYFNYLMINYYFFSNLSKEERNNTPIPIFLLIQIVGLCISIIAYICENWDKTIINTNKFK